MSAWKHTVRLADLARGPVSVTLEPDAETRAVLAKELGLESLPALTARLTVRPWLDGAEINGRFKARVEQICGVTLDPFESELDGDVAVRAVPTGSPNAPAESAGGEVEMDLDAPDPPDVLATDELDLAGYLVEHLALEIDPFPRKPGAEFDYTPDAPEESPFAVLKRLKDDGA
ncbi:YceD family protein [Phenylobacterium sp.]|uniref:YceD family protein n=1 Tax=Phenylobacterium sp. TaxID=1871053 RepID=UPI00289F7AA0|nr:YceD family protein [Phenylobacterium sp.]